MDGDDEAGPDRRAGGTAAERLLATAAGAAAGLTAGTPAAWSRVVADLLVDAFRAEGLAAEIVAGDGGPIGVVAASGGTDAARTLVLVAAIGAGELPAIAVGTAVGTYEGTAVRSGWGSVAASLAAATALSPRIPEGAGLAVHVVIGDAAEPGAGHPEPLHGRAPRPAAALVASAISGSAPAAVLAVPGVLRGSVEVEGRVTHCGNRAGSIRPGGGGDALGINALEKGLLVIDALRRLEEEWLRTHAHPGLAPASCTIGVTAFDADAGFPFPAKFPDRGRIVVRVDHAPADEASAVIAEIEAYVRAATALDPWLREHPPVFSWRPVRPPLAIGSDDPLAVAVAGALATGGDVHDAAAARRPSVGRSAAPAYAAAGIPALAVGLGSGALLVDPGERIGADEVAALAGILERSAVAWWETPRGT